MNLPEKLSNQMRDSQLQRIEVIWMGGENGDYVRMSSLGYFITHNDISVTLVPEFLLPDLEVGGEFKYDPSTAISIPRNLIQEIYYLQPSFIITPSYTPQT